VFIGNETGRIKPHGFYQVCKVCGKNSTQCTEREIEGTNVIEIEVSPLTNMQVK
jgi:nuclear factor of activated T-cells 5